MRADQLETGGGRTRAHLWNAACTRAQKLLEQRFLGLGLVHFTPQTHPGKLALVTSKLVPRGTGWSCNAFITQEALQGKVR